MKNINLKSLKNWFAPVAGGVSSLPLLAGPAEAALPGFLGAASLGPLTLSAPLMLGALVMLRQFPRLWRVTQPEPKRVAFPSVSLLHGLQSKEQQPATVPWPEYLTRMAILAGAVFLATGPSLNPEPALKGDGPLVLVIDNDFAARDWDTRRANIAAWIDRAGKDNRPVALLATAQGEDGAKIAVQGPMSATEAQRLAEDLQPHAWSADRTAALGALNDFKIDGKAEIVWMSDGLDSPSADALQKALLAIGNVTILSDRTGELPYLLAPAPAANAPGRIAATVKRAPGGAAEIVTIVAQDDAGRELARGEAVFEDGAGAADVTFDLPDEIANQLTQLRLADQYNPASVVLIDERWRRRPVGLLPDDAAAQANPLLSGAHYIAQAVAPFADLRRGTVDQLLKGGVSVLVLTDDNAIDDTTRQSIEDWIRRGGTLLRFAGPTLAANPADSLLPVPVAFGERVLDDAGLSMAQPSSIAPFDAQSPFFGLATPGDVAIGREVLAQSEGGPDSEIWARLQDGSPLVAAQKRGRGWTVQIMTTADQTWSNLSLSGTFVDMLRTVIARSQPVGTVGAPSTLTLDPVKTLDAAGRLTSPSPTVAALPARDTPPIDARHPPGLYGGEGAMRALNLGDALPGPAPLQAVSGVTQGVYVDGHQTDLPSLLADGVLALIILDTFLRQLRNGGFNTRRPRVLPIALKTSDPSP